MSSAEVDRDDVGALFGQPDRVAAALPARRAGDECDLSLERVPLKMSFRYLLIALGVSAAVDAEDLPVM